MSDLTASAGFRLIYLPSVGIEGLRLFQGATPDEAFWAQTREQIAAEVRLLELSRPALVVGDCRPTLYISTRAADVLYVGIIGATWTTHFFGSRLSMPEAAARSWHRLVPRCLLERSVARRHRTGKAAPNLARWNQLATEFGAPRVGHPSELYRGELGLVSDCRELVADRAFPADLPFVGPLVWEGAGTVPEGLGESGMPLVYVTFGSTGPDWVMETVIEAVRGLPVEAVMSVGPHHDPTSFRSAANLSVLQVVPGLEMARRASLVVCHGGIGSLYQAAAGGSPIIGIPGHFEQQWNIELFQRWGCALGLPGRELRVTDVRTAIRVVLKEGRFERRARDLQRVIGTYDAPNAAAELILRALESDPKRAVRSKAASLAGHPA